MEASENIEVNLADMLEAGWPIEKKQRKNVIRYFESLGGNDNPIEAVELGLRRNKSLRTAQLKTLSEILRYVENPAETVVSITEISKDELEISVYFESNV